MQPLPPELLAIVAEYFTPRNAIQPCCVCRTWNMAFSPVIWRRYTLESHDPREEINRQALIRNAPHIRHLTFDRLDLLIKFDLSCTQLTHLVFTGRYRSLSPSDEDQDWRKLARFIEQNPWLGKISISASKYDIPVDFWTALPLCPSWDISSASADPSELFWAACWSVAELNITNTEVFDTTEFFNDAQGVYTNMKRITLPNSATASSVALVLEQCPNLTSFAMDLWDGCSFEVVAATLGGMLEQGRLPHLDSLGLTSHVQDDDLASCIQAMSSVLDLDCTSTFFGPLAFAALEPKFATLRTLQVQKCQCVSGDMIQTILESCPALEELVSTSIPARLIMDGRPWACLGLKKLVLDFYLDSGTGLQAQSSAVFGQLGRLTRLKTLMIGDSLSFLHSSFQGLDFRLQSGLGQLAGLERLATLDFGQTRQELGVDDVAWMKRHLKELTAVLGTCNNPVGLYGRVARFWNTVRPRKAMMQRKKIRRRSGQVNAEGVPVGDVAD